MSAEPHSPQGCLPPLRHIPTPAAGPAPPPPRPLTAATDVLGICARAEGLTQNTSVSMCHCTSSMHVCQDSMMRGTPVSGEGWRTIGTGDICVAAACKLGGLCIIAMADNNLMTDVIIALSLVGMCLSTWGVVSTCNPVAE